MPSANASPPELGEEIFAHILNKALNNRMVDPSMIFIDGTHIKASANKKKFQKEQVAKGAKVYEEQLRKEVSEERKKESFRQKTMVHRRFIVTKWLLLSSETSEKQPYQKMAYA